MTRAYEPLILYVGHRQSCDPRIAPSVLFGLLFCGVLPALPAFPRVRFLSFSAVAPALGPGFPFWLFWLGPGAPARLFCSALAIRELARDREL